MNSAELSDQLLYRLFQRSRGSSNGYAKLRNIRFDADLPQAGMEANFLHRLQSRRLVELKYPEREEGILGVGTLTSLMREQEYQISLRGIDYVLEELDRDDSYIKELVQAPSKIRVQVYPVIGGAVRKQPAPPPTSAPVVAPAADRVVPLNHNQPEVKEIQEGISGLKEGLQRGNDHGSMTAEERQQAISEIGYLEQIFDGVLLRIAYTKMVAIQSLTWISDKAGGALVGEAAKHLLASIIAFCGLN